MEGWRKLRDGFWLGTLFLTYITEAVVPESLLVLLGERQLGQEMGKILGGSSEFPRSLQTGRTSPACSDQGKG